MSNVEMQYESIIKILKQQEDDILHTNLLNCMLYSDGVECVKQHTTQSDIEYTKDLFMIEALFAHLASFCDFIPNDRENSENLKIRREFIRNRVMQLFDYANDKLREMGEDND